MINKTYLHPEERTTPGIGILICESVKTDLDGNIINAPQKIIALKETMTQDGAIKNFKRNN